MGTHLEGGKEGDCPPCVSRMLVPVPTAGKTTLIKALTGDTALQPRDQLFATLDVTAHAGWLPSRVPVLYMDTVGFLSRLPHGLIQAFSATLGDVAHSVGVVTLVSGLVGGVVVFKGPPHLSFRVTCQLPSVVPHPQDVVVHVRDVAHPDTDLQKETVLSTLQGLRLPPALLGSVLEVHNKVDLVPG